MNADARIRHLVANWSDAAPRGAVSEFCREHQVSRSWFYKVRAAALAGGPGKAMERASTRPVSSPRKTSRSMERLLLKTRASLKKAGSDYGSTSVMTVLERQGVKPPSRATVYRIFARAGVVKEAPKTQNRSFRLVTSLGTNGYWQVDAGWLPDENTTVVIFEPIGGQDRHSVAFLAKNARRSESDVRVVAVRTEPGELTSPVRTERAHHYQFGNVKSHEDWYPDLNVSPPVLSALEKPTLQNLKSVTRKVDNNGTVTVFGTHFQVGKTRTGQKVIILHNDTTITFFDHRGTVIIGHPIPSKGTPYVGNTIPVRIHRRTA